jgi:hypothetical protein
MCFKTYLILGKTCFSLTGVTNPPAFFEGG